ncbi:XRE family transcriptional regulator [Pseudomethylobacillus aquaticus]|uniref:XRE family transcriptional regulator n=1 Tax=Pseudomethylobacillus aquaticus TaxID=2676064 RepID=A0A3N0V0T0_9PROT|nr:helix-turn-helix transcriptional regulator [Pseudomethylobacillus aquaticus]ROH86131.1 XRE family transcriptional regulator [Pseudomethylobacillus aquaticus]
MPRQEPDIVNTNQEVRSALDALGARLRAHRIQQGWTVDNMASRLFCSATTYRALEAGKPGTSIGMLANALWMLGQLDSLDSVAPPIAAFQSVRRVRRKAQQAPGQIGDDERDF